jgi:hypothetical protein
VIAVADAGVRTRVKGTLGVVVTVHQQQLLTREEAIERVLDLRARPDYPAQRRIGC